MKQRFKMKYRLVIPLLLYIFVSCNPRIQDEPEFEIELNGVKMKLPKGYSIFRPESGIADGYLVKDNCFKIGFNTGGIGVLPTAHPEDVKEPMKMKVDTIGNFVKMTAYRTDEGTDITLDIVGLKVEDTTIFDLFGYETEMRHNYLLTMSTFDPGNNLCLTKEEQLELLEVFEKIELK